jgi:hypothetical protein
MFCCYNLLRPSCLHCVRAARKTNCYVLLQWHEHWILHAGVSSTSHTYPVPSNSYDFSSRNLCKHTNSIHQIKPCLTITKTILLLLYRATLAVYSQKCASMAGRDIRCSLSQNIQTKSQSQPAFCTMVTIRCFLWDKVAGASYPGY